MSDRNRGLLAAFAGIAALVTAAAFGAYYGSLYGPAHKQYQAVDAGQTTDPTYQGVTQSLPDIALIPDPVERAIANPAPDSGQDHEKRDLAAQESMAAWAFYVVVFAGLTSLITFFGTILIWKQVSLTREAVEETAKATGAMLRQNELTEAAQRPWLKIDAKVIKAESDGESLTLQAKITVTNIGKMVANYAALECCIVERDDVLKGQKRIGETKRNAIAAATPPEPRPGMAYPLMPGESFSIQSEIFEVPEAVCCDVGVETGCALFAFARYYIPGEWVLRETDRSFVFSYGEIDENRINQFDHYGIPVPLPDDVSPETVFFRRGKRNWTT